MGRMKTALLRALVWFGGISRELADFLAPLFRDSLSRLLSRLLPIALDVVSSLATTDKSGRDKQRVAADTIKAIAIAEGIAVTTRAVNLAIELALQKLEDSK